jgi:hypothetical protein
MSRSQGCMRVRPAGRLAGLEAWQTAELDIRPGCKTVGGSLLRAYIMLLCVYLAQPPDPGTLGPAALLTQSLPSFPCIERRSLR